MKYYTYYKKIIDKIYFRFIDDSGTDNLIIEDIPKVLFYEGTSNKDSKFLAFPSFKKVFPKKYDDVSDYFMDKKNLKDNVFGFSEDKLFIFNLYRKNKDKLIQKFNLMKVLSLDIEVYTGIDNSIFPEASEANFPISVIGMKEIGLQNDNLKKFFIFTTKDFKINETFKNFKVEKMIYETEEEMLEGFTQFIHNYKPHMITGWNVINYDMQYILNRIKRLFGKRFPVLLSDLIPFKIPRQKIINNLNRYLDVENLTYILGISIIDYMEIFKKFSDKKYPKYSLDYVAKKILKKGKTEYSMEYTDLTNLYEQNYDLYIEYNMNDVYLIELFEKELHLLKMIINFSYLTLINFEKCMATLAPAETLLEYFLYKEKLIPSLYKKDFIKKAYPGGYVKQPQSGEFNWITIFDITSSYPNQIISYNISIETLIDDSDLPNELKQLKKKLLLKAKKMNLDEYNIEEVLLDVKYNKKYILPLLKKYDVILTPNLNFISRKIDGMIPKMISFMFKERLKWKKLEREFKSKLK